MRYNHLPETLDYLNANIERETEKTQYFMILKRNRDRRVTKFRQRLPSSTPTTINVRIASMSVLIKITVVKIDRRNGHE